MSHQTANGPPRTRNIIRKPAVRRKTGYGDSQIWRFESSGDFPKRIQLGPMAVGWFEDEVDEWVRTRARGMGKRPPKRGAGDPPPDELVRIARLRPSASVEEIVGEIRKAKAEGA